MLFILPRPVAMAALIVWRAAAKKVEEKNFASRGVTGIAGAVAGFFVLLAFANASRLFRPETLG
jgi:hypothetical protein